MRLVPRLHRDPIPGFRSLHVSPQFCHIIVQESPPVVHRLRLSSSPEAPTDPGQISFTLETLDIRPRGFSPLSRYSFRHSLFHAVHSSFRYCFFPHAMLLYQPFGSLVSVARFSPGHFRRRTSRPVSYYALFEWMAASEPTSWLSSKSHILFHLTRTWGP